MHRLGNWNQWVTGFNRSSLFVKPLKEMSVDIAADIARIGHNPAMKRYGHLDAFHFKLSQRPVHAPDGAFPVLRPNHQFAD